MTRIAIGFLFFGVVAVVLTGLGYVTCLLLRTGKGGPPDTVTDWLVVGSVVFSVIAAIGIASWAIGNTFVELTGWWNG